jgi:hypothetical protein
MAQIDAPENYPSVRGSRSQAQLYPLTAVQANANGTGECLQGSLFKHALILIGLFSQKSWDFVVVHAT